MNTNDLPQELDAGIAGPAPSPTYSFATYTYDNYDQPTFSPAKPVLTASDALSSDVPVYGSQVVGQGWSSMARIVREVDEQKVKDCKEDIDTILTFAGLFSASLTAFLVESYKNLQPNTSDIMVSLMQQNLAQTSSYTLSSGFLNSTIAFQPSNSTSFRPTTNSVWVNTLWFLSLALTLVSASFTILVKQWLREYLAGDYTSPQVRLRVRHFRNPALRDWRVFEIAATLPMLLQLSLCLFLIGLCLFTIEVYSTIGYLTTAVVSAWGFFVIATTFSPAVSSRCPYKITSLITIMRELRKQLFRFMRWSSRKHLVPLTQHTSKWSHVLAQDEQHATSTDQNDVDILIAVDSTQTDEHLLGMMWDALQQTENDPERSVTFMRKLISHRMHHSLSSPPLPPIPSAGLISASSDLREEISFSVITPASTSSFLDLNGLTKQTTITIMLMASQLLETELKHRPLISTSEDFVWSPWMRDCLDILLSHTNAPVPPPVNKMLSFLLSEPVRYKRLFEVIKSLSTDLSLYPHIFAKLRGALILVEGEDQLIVLHSLIQHYFCTGHGDEHHDMVDIAHDSDTHRDFTPVNVRDLIDFLVDSLTQRMQPDMVWFPHLAQQLNIILKLSGLSCDTGPRPSSTIVIFVQNLLTRCDIDVYCMFMLGYKARHRYAVKNEARSFFIEAVLTSNTTERRAIIWKLGRLMLAQSQQHYRNRLAGKNVRGLSTGDHFRLDPLEACRVLLCLLDTMKSRNLPITTIRNVREIRDFFKVVDEGLRLTADLQDYDSHRDIARGCLELINGLDLSVPPDSGSESSNDGAGDVDQAFSTWAEEFPERRSRFPETFIDALRRFLPFGDDTSFSHRVRRHLYFEQLESTTQGDIIDPPSASTL